MNEKTLKLFTMACYHGDYEPENVPNEVVEKFAELIVRECAKLQHKNVIVGGVSDYNRGRRTLAEDILKHFGVEE